jgi:tetratricopeptide (TPR) repeat protein
MKIYVSWSGELARQASEILRSSLQRVFPTLDVWITGSDISVGMRWVDEIHNAVRTSALAILCVTKESRSSPWINFELGMLVASGSRVVPWVIDLDPSELSGPLAQYQAADSFERLVRVIVDVDPKSGTAEHAHIAEWSREFDESIRHLTGRSSRSSVIRTSDDLADRLNAATSARNIDELRSVRAVMATYTRADPALVRALLKAHMTLRDFEGVIESFETFSDVVDGSGECQSLLGLALVRTKRYERAIPVLIAARQLAPHDPEIVAVLGQAYKNHWRMTGAEDSLRLAVEAYVESFQLDPSHYYSGLNAVELLHLIGDDQSIARRDRLLPEVERGVRQEILRDPDSPWAFASLLELAVIKEERAEAESAAERLQMHDRLVRLSTAEQLRLLLGAEAPGRKTVDWVQDIISRLLER